MDSQTTTDGVADAGKGDGRYRVLLVADEVVRGEDLAAELKSHVKQASDTVLIYVIATVIPHSALDQELGNVDPWLPEAGQRMRTLLSEIHDAGFEAEGRVGDADPLVAIGDGLAEFDADEVVVVTHSDSHAERTEEGVWERLRTDFHQPITQLKVEAEPAEAEPEVVDVRHVPAHETTPEEEIRENATFPPLNRRDVTGIMVGVLGTIALGVIALAAGTQDDGELSGRAAVILLIAIGAFLFNVAHIVGLLFFQSVRYTGIWERFMARGSMLVTTVGLAVALFLWLT